MDRQFNVIILTLKSKATHFKTIVDLLFPAVLFIFQCFPLAQI